MTSPVPFRDDDALRRHPLCHRHGVDLGRGDVAVQRGGRVPVVGVVDLGLGAHHVASFPVRGRCAIAARSAARAPGPLLPTMPGLDGHSR